MELKNLTSEKEKNRDPPDEDGDFEEIPNFTIAMLSVFGIAVPTWDQYSDYYLNGRLLSETDLRTRRFGYIMLVPIFLMTFFSIRHWWKLEKYKRNRLYTLPFVIFQIFPQYRAARILYLGFCKKKSWKTENDLYDRDLMSLEPFLEAIPQIHIQLCLSVSKSTLYTACQLNGGNGAGYCDPSYTPYDWQFVATFATSVLTGAFGVAKFMKLGPCKMIPKESGFMIGFASFGFPAVAWSIIVALLGKALMLPVEIAPNPEREGDLFRYRRISIWMALNLAPQLIYACSVLIVSLGLKNTAEVIWKYPAIVFTPMIGIWTFGQARNNRFDCCSYSTSKTIRVSKFHTWITYFISVIGTISTFFLWTETSQDWTMAKFQERINSLMVSSNFLNAKTWEESAVFLSWILMLIILPINIAFVQIIDNFSENLCSFVSSNCFPVIKKTELDVEKIDDDLP